MSQSQSSQASSCFQQAFPEASQVVEQLRAPRASGGASSSRRRRRIEDDEDGELPDAGAAAPSPSSRQRVDAADGGGAAAPGSPNDSLIDAMDDMQEEEEEDEGGDREPEQRCPQYVLDDFKSIPALLRNVGDGRRFRFPLDPVPDEHNLVPFRASDFNFSSSAKFIFALAISIFFQ